MHCNDVSLRLAWAIQELKKIPKVLAVHDPETHSGEQNWRRELSRWLTFSQVERFIVHSKGFKDAFAARYGIPSQRVEFVPLGVYDIYREWIDTPVRSDEDTVLFFGRLSPYKGLEVLYEAAPLVAEKVPNVRLIVAGRAVLDYEAPLPPVLPNNGHIEIISEYVTNNRLTRLFQESAVVVCPYVDATQSGVVLTAYAFGKPVIATNTGGLPEYVKQDQTGLLVPPGDAEALSVAIVKILNDKSLRLRLNQGIKTVKETELSWNRIGKQTLGIYAKTLQTQH